MVIGSLEFKERADVPGTPGSGKQKVFVNQSGQLVSLGSSGTPDPYVRASDISTTIIPHDHDSLYYRKSTALALSIALA